MCVNLKFFCFFFTFQLLAISFKASFACKFPSRWMGNWFQKGIKPPIQIKNDNFSLKGICIDYSGDMFLIHDKQENCFRCLVIYEKHINVLQYRETYCDEQHTLETACERLTVDTQLYSMFRVNGSSVECPFKGSFTFTYSNGYGECRHPISTAETCIDNSRLLFKFQPCTDIPGTESSVELKCLATWKEGSTQYLIGNMKIVNSYKDGDTYRCFVYDFLRDRNLYQISQSVDASCDGLTLSYEDSRTMLLRKNKLPIANCVFPNELARSRIWYSLDGTIAYVFSRMNSSYRITHTLENMIISKLICLEEVLTTGNSTTVIAYQIQGCTNGYVCLAFYQRDANIVEIKIGQKSRNPYDPCEILYYTDNIEYTTLIAPSANYDICPKLTEINGLKININKINLLPEDCKANTTRIVGCRSRNTLEFLITCNTFRDLMTFYCYGLWEEDKKYYLIAGLKDFKAKYCFVYTIDKTVNTLSVLYGTCHRNIRPETTENFTLEIKATECDLQNHSSIHENFAGLFIIIIMIICGLIQ